jgi:antitoxin component YwqK of YwqJK toxin-antitoxin module
MGFGKNGILEYEGHWEGGVAHGRGTRWFNQTGKLEGDWNLGAPVGEKKVVCGPMSFVIVE